MSHGRKPTAPRTSPKAPQASAASNPARAAASTRARRTKRRFLGTMSTAALDAMPDAAFLYDTDGTILYANGMARALFGLDTEPGIERISLQERVARIAPRTPDGQPLPHEQWHVTRLLSGEVITSANPVLAFVTSLDGRELFLSYTGAPIYDKAGHIVGAIAVGRDLLERHRQRLAREAAQAEREHLEAAAQRAATEAMVRAGEIEAIFEAMTDGVVVYGPDGEVRRMNSAYRRLLALDEAELLRPISARGQAIAPRLPTGEPLPEAEWPSARIRRGEVLTGPHSMDVLVRSHDGHDVLINCAGAPVRDAQGQIEASVMVIRDVTEARRATHLMAERARELEATFQAMTDAVIVVDAQGAILRRNAAAERLYAQSTPSDFAARPIAERVSGFELYTAEGRRLANDEWPAMRVLRGKTLANETMEDVFYHDHAGQVVWLNASGVPLRDTDGTIIGGVIVYRDVTARRALERRTHEVLDALIAMAETLVELPSQLGTASALPPQARKYPVAHRLADLTCRVLGCGRVGITAVDLATGSQRAIAVVGLSPEQERQWWAEQEAQQTRFGEGASPDELARFLAGEIFQLDMTQPPYDQQPNPYGITSVLVAPMRAGTELIGILTLDHSGVPHTFTREELRLTEAVAQLGALVLERERLVRERELAQANLLAAEEASRRMGAFLSIASHELRTPVTAILPAIQVLIQRAERAATPATDPTATDSTASMSPATEGRRRSTEAVILRRTERQVARLVRLLDDLVDVARLREDRLDLRLAPCDLSGIVREIVEEQQTANPGRIHLASTPEPAPLLVRADADRLGQVLTNYLTNALKYSAASAPVEVRMWAADGRATVAVRDHGPGIPPEEYEHIWELFHRVPGIEVRSGSGIGLGLGLHISKTLVERHGGQVGVESEVGAGSTFWFALPLAPAEDNA